MWIPDINYVTEFKVDAGNGDRRKVIRDIVYIVYYNGLVYVFS